MQAPLRTAATGSSRRHNAAMHGRPCQLAPRGTILVPLSGTAAALLPFCQLQRTWGPARVDVRQHGVRGWAHAAHCCRVRHKGGPAWPGQGPRRARHAWWHGHGHARCPWGWHGYGPGGQRAAWRAWRAQWQRAIGPHLGDGHVEQLLQRGHHVALQGRGTVVGVASVAAHRRALPAAVSACRCTWLANRKRAGRC